MKTTMVLLSVAVVASICLAGAIPDKHWEPATISLTYSVSVPKDVPFKVTKTWGKDNPDNDPGHDDAAWRKNRRDDFVVLNPPK